MRRLLGVARTRVGVTVIGTALLIGGGTAAAAVVTSSPATDEVSDVQPVTSEPAATSSAPAAESPAVGDTPEASIDAVTPDAPPPAEPPAPTAPAAIGDQSGDSYDPSKPYVDGSGTTYVPAPDVPVPPMDEELETAPPLGD